MGTLEILESARECDVWDGKTTLASFYKSAGDPNGSKAATRFVQGELAIEALTDILRMAEHAKAESPIGFGGIILTATTALTRIKGPVPGYGK